jgi:Bifunctional DNA primase/polymerase, N-terminal
MKAGVTDVAELLHRAHGGRAWVALGYVSWKEYCRAEFQMSKPRSYQLLKFVEIKREIERSTFVDPPQNEGQTRALGSVPAEKRVEVWERANEWWKSDPQDFDTAKWFKGSRCYNIGFAPRDNVVVVDLDSKPDQGRSVKAFRAERSELKGTPLHRTRGGVHLVFRCLDLPQWKHSNGRPYYERLESQVSKAVSAELFHSDHSNVVLPPSIHALDDFVYRWETFGEFREVSWRWLQENFGFESPQQSKKELPWHLEFEGNLR